MDEKERPVANNNREVPIFIFKDGMKMHEAASIQGAARWLKQHTGDQFFRFRPIERGYVYGESWSWNGSTYTFTSDKENQANRRKQLDS